VIDLNKNESTYIVNLESNFFTTSPLSTSPANLLPSFLKDIKKNKDKCFKDGRNFIRSLIALTTFSQIKNKTIASITTEAISQFFKNFILTATNILAHFTVNWASYVLHANKIATIISFRLIQKNTYEQYVSANRELLEKTIENSDEYIVFFTHIYKHLQNADPPIPHTNIKQISNSLSKVIYNTIQYNLAQVLPQFCGAQKPPCKICHSTKHFTNQYPNKSEHQQQIDEYTYFPRHTTQLCHHFSTDSHTSTLITPILLGFTTQKPSNAITEHL
jgi:hypothetical protein